MYRKLFISIFKAVSLILILSCSILFTDIASSQVTDETGNPTTENTDSSNDSNNTFLYVGVAAVMVIVAVALLITNKDKKTESGKNPDTKDSTGVNKIENLQIKKKDKFDKLDDELILNIK